MKKIGTVYGDAEQAKPLVINKDTVYVHTDITPAEIDGKAVDELFSYTETQYSKDEYIEILAQRNEKLNSDITDVQLALCELYEMLGGAQ